MKYVPIEVRFWQKVHKTKKCWYWLGCITPTGYGYISKERGVSPRSVHRLSWELHNGKIPKGMHVLHKCDNPSCVRPSHLWLGNHLQNMADRQKKGRTRGAVGVKNGRAKITPTDVRAIRKMRDTGSTYEDIALVYKLNPSTVSSICRRLNWKHVK